MPITTKVTDGINIPSSNYKAGRGMYRSGTGYAPRPKRLKYDDSQAMFHHGDDNKRYGRDKYPVRPMAEYPIQPMFSNIAKIMKYKTVKGNQYHAIAPCSR
jgi:hypothetical protein